MQASSSLIPGIQKWPILSTFLHLSACVIPENIHTSHTEGILLRPPIPVEIESNQASYISLNFLALQNPTPPMKLQSLLWGEYGYFLELQNIVAFLKVCRLQIKGAFNLATKARVVKRTWQLMKITVCYMIWTSFSVGILSDFNP